MKTNRTFALVAFFIFAAVSLMIVNQGAALAVDAALVTIEPVKNDKGEIEGFFINPQKLEIEKDTVVVWLSGIADQDIQVVFEDGRACKDVTANPHGFLLDAKSCYVTNYLAYGATSSLKFPEAGTFKYVVKSQDEKLVFKAKLVVR